MRLIDTLVLATARANRRAAEAEARCRTLENLIVAEQARADRATTEADALYHMLPEEIRPTT